MASSNNNSSDNPLSPAELYRRYGRLIVEVGWGGKAGISGKPVHIYAGVPAYPVVLATAEAAYKLGAARVDFTIMSNPLDALHVQYATEENLVKIPRTWADRWNDLVPVKGATVRIEGADDQLALARCDPQRVSKFESARKKARDLFYDEGLQKNTTPWSIVPFASQDWATQLFPSMDPVAAQKKLEAALVTVLGLEHDDFIERWWARGKKIAKRCELLNKLGIDSLHFKGPNTDLIVGLDSRAWFGGGMHDGAVSYFANLPTFECYTTPDFRRTTGTVRTTRPILINGQNVEGVQITFQNGKVVNFSAEKGAAAFEAMLEEDDGARFLGEVALVGIDDSPIYSTGIVFESILLDENAACHIAFGEAYSAQLHGGLEMNSEQKRAVGCNESKVHRDCMISNEQTTVIATTRSGEKVVVIENGAWAGQFKSL